MPPRAREPQLSTLTSVARAVGRRDAADTLFGLPMLGATLEEQLEALQTAYRRLVIIAHPDRNPQSLALATSTLATVNALRDHRETEIRARGVPALPGPAGRSGGFTSRRATSGSIIRSQPSTATPWDDGYDDEAPPPLPACMCVTIARETLPGRVVFCERSGQDWAVRTSDQRAVAVVHTWECSRYRRAYPTTVSEQGIAMHGGMFSHHMPGWCWVRARLEQQAAVDHFAQQRR